MTTKETIPPVEQVRSTLQAKQVTPSHIDALCWMLDDAAKSGITDFGELAKVLNRNALNLKLIVSGQCGDNLAKVVAQIERYRSGVRTRTASAKYLAETSVIRIATQFCDTVRNNNALGILWGPNQSGKSTALQHYASAKRDERTFFVRMPGGGQYGRLMENFVTAMSLPIAGNSHTHQSLLMRQIKPDDLVIVDEFHQCLLGRVRTRTVECLREIWDETGCGMLLCGTDVIPNALADAKLTGFMAQLGNRAPLQRRIPPEPTRLDILRICDAFGFPPLAPGEARNRVEGVAMKHGIGRLTRLLTLTRKISDKQRRAPIWADFLATLATLGSWAAGKAEEMTWEQAEAEFGAV